MNNIKPSSFAEYNQKVTSFTSNTNTSGKQNNLNQKKSLESNKEEKNKLLKLLRGKNTEITKNRKEINKININLEKSRIEDEKKYLNKRIDILNKQNSKLSKERTNIIKKILKIGETLNNLLSRKIIDEGVINEMENNSKMTDFSKPDKKKSIKDKSKTGKGKQQQQLSYFQKQLKACFKS